MVFDPRNLRTCPRHDFDTVATWKKNAHPDLPLRFAELAIDGRTLRYCVSSPLSEMRVRSLFVKEPGTIEWIHSFQPAEVMVDVGANVGLYSLYAAAVAQVQVYAFEPESQNFAELCRSVFLNRAHRRVHAYCAALGEREVELSDLLVSRFATGESYHDFGEPSHDYPAARRFAQGSIGLSLDYLVERQALPVPDHVKIDVDGHEHKVVAGMRRILEGGELRTLNLECDGTLPGTREMVAWLLGRGWHVNPDQVRFSRGGIRPAGRVMDELQRGAFRGNVVFGRRPEYLEYATRALARFSGADLEYLSVPE